MVIKVRAVDPYILVSLYVLQEVLLHIMLSLVPLPVEQLDSIVPVLDLTLQPVGMNVHTEGIIHYV